VHALDFFGAGLCAAVSDKRPASIERKGDADEQRLVETQTSVSARLFLEGEKSLSSFKQVKGRCDASYAAADGSD
jgi:hypothetical protein